MTPVVWVGRCERDAPALDALTPATFGDDRPYAPGMSRRAERRRQRERQRARGAWLRGFIVALLLGVVAEVGLRSFWTPPEVAKRPDAQSLVMHETRMWGLAPGTQQIGTLAMTIGEHGLRETELSGAPHRILTLGDSTIFGHELRNDQALHGRVAAELNMAGHHTDVLCGAVPGYSSEQARQLLTDVGWSLEPTLLVIGTYWSDSSYAHFVDQEWMAVLNGPLAQVGRALEPLMLWQWARTVVAPRRQLSSGQAVNEVAWIKEPRPDQGRRVPLQRYAENLDAMLHGARERGIGAVLLRPVNRERYSGVERNAAMYADAQERVARHHGIPVLDPVGAMQASGLSADAAYLDKVHPSPAGMRDFARGVAEQLLAAGWPEDPLVPSASGVFAEELSDPGAQLDPLVEGVSGPVAP